MSKSKGNTRRALRHRILASALAFLVAAGGIQPAYASVAETELLTEAMTEAVTEVATEVQTDAVSAETAAETQPETVPSNESVNESVTEDETAAPETEVVTEAVTVPEEAVQNTEEETAAPAETEIHTENVTEVPTEAPTEAVTEAPTKDVTEEITEPVTEEPTEAPTETESESESESETEESLPEMPYTANVKREVIEVEDGLRLKVTAAFPDEKEWAALQETGLIAVFNDCSFDREMSDPEYIEINSDSSVWQEQVLAAMTGWSSEDIAEYNTAVLWQYDEQHRQPSEYVYYLTLPEDMVRADAEAITPVFVTGDTLTRAAYNGWTGLELVPEEIESESESEIMSEDASESQSESEEESETASESESETESESEPESETETETESESESETEEPEENSEYLCGLEEHVHIGECYDEEGNLICTLLEHTHTEECVKPIVSTFSLARAERLPLLDALVDGKIDVELKYVDARYSSDYVKTVYSWGTQLYPDYLKKYDFIVRLNNMSFIDGIIEEGAVYEYPLPSELVPTDDVLGEGESAPDPNDLSTWTMLVSNGRAQGRGCIEKTDDGRYNLLLTFLEGTTEHETNIAVTYQYHSTLSSDLTSVIPNDVSIPFEGGSTFRVYWEPYTGSSQSHNDPYVYLYQRSSSYHAEHRVQYQTEIQCNTDYDFRFSIFKGTLKESIDAPMHLVPGLSKLYLTINGSKYTVDMFEDVGKSITTGIKLTSVSDSGFTMSFDTSASRGYGSRIYVEYDAYAWGLDGPSSGSTSISAKSSASLSWECGGYHWDSDYGYIYRSGTGSDSATGSVGLYAVDVNITDTQTSGAKHTVTFDVNSGNTYWVGLRITPKGGSYLTQFHLDPFTGVFRDASNASISSTTSDDMDILDYNEFLGRSSLPSSCKLYKFGDSDYTVVVQGDAWDLSTAVDGLYNEDSGKAPLQTMSGSNAGSQEPLEVYLYGLHGLTSGTFSVDVYDFLNTNAESGVIIEANNGGGWIPVSTTFDNTYVSALKNTKAYVQEDGSVRLSGSVLGNSIKTFYDTLKAAVGEVGTLGGNSVFDYLIGYKGLDHYEASTFVDRNDATVNLKDSAAWVVNGSTPPAGANIARYGSDCLKDNYNALHLLSDGQTDLIQGLSVPDSLPFNATFVPESGISLGASGYDEAGNLLTSTGNHFDADVSFLLYNSALLTPAFNDINTVDWRYPLLAKKVDAICDDDGIYIIHSTLMDVDDSDFSGVYSIHDDMSGSLAYKADGIATYDESVAEHTYLQSMQIKLSNQDAIDLDLSKLQTGVNTFSLGNGVTAYLDYSGNMDGGFDLKIELLYNTAVSTVTYDCTLNTGEYSAAAQASGVVNLNFSNSARLNYSMIADTNSATTTAKTSGFYFTTCPDANLVVDDSKENTNAMSGNYTTSYKGDAYVGPTGCVEAYLTGQVRSVKNEDGTEIPLDKILPYISSSISEVIITSEQPDGKDVDVTGDFTWELISNPSDILQNVTPVNGNAINGNQFCMKLTRNDGQMITDDICAEVLFDVTVSSGLHALEEYKGGKLGIDVQFAISHPFDAGAGGSGLEGATFVSAGAYVESYSYLRYPFSIKYPYGDGWILSHYAGTVEPEEKALWGTNDILYISACLNGAAVTDNILNDNLVKLFFKHLNIDDVAIYEDHIAEDSKVWPGVDGFSVNIGPIEGTYDYEGGDGTNPGKGHMDILNVNCTGLTYGHTYDLYYKLNPDWEAILHEAIELGYITESDTLTFPDYENVLSDEEDGEAHSGNFKDPAEILGTIKKSSNADWENGKINWDVAFDVKGNAIRNYTINDVMAAGNAEGVATENDNIAFDNMDFQKFMIVATKEDDTEETLFTYEGPFDVGTEVKVPDSDYYDGAKLIIQENLNFALQTSILRAGSLHIRYVTAFDEAGFVDAGGSLLDGFQVYNTVTATAPGVRISASDGETYRKPDDNTPEKTVAETDGMTFEREWTIKAYTVGNYVKHVHIGDTVTATPEAILDYLYITDMKVDLILADGSTKTVYDTAENIDQLADYTGEFQNYNPEESSSFDLEFDTLPSRTNIVVTYHTSVKAEEYWKAIEDGELKVSKDSYKVSNKVTYKQDGASEKETTTDTDFDIDEKIEKSGRLYRESGRENDAVTEWALNVHLDSIATKAELEAAEAAGIPAVVIDSLPFGLEYDATHSGWSYLIQHSIQGIGVATSNNVLLPDDAYTAGTDPENPQKLVINLLKPATYPDVKIVFFAKATANLGAVKNTASVSIAGKTETDRSDEVKDVFTAHNGGTITSVTLPKFQPKALKLLDGNAPGMASFDFSCVQVAMSEDDGWQTVAGGYTSTATSDENGKVLFDETDFLDPGEYYYRISEVPDESLDAPDYEGPAYEYDKRSYILHVQTVLDYNEWIVVSDVIDVLDGEADISQMKVPTFENTTKPLQKVTVVKTWEDEEDAGGLRPENLTVQLMRNGAVYSTHEGYEVILNKDNGWTYTWENLPTNGTYSVQELTDFDNADSYEPDEPVVTTEDNATTVALTNRLSVTHLSVSKTVAGNMGDKSKDFSFKLTLTSSGEVPASLTYTKGETTGTINLADGGYAFTLAHGETITFTNIPVGLTYAVTELDGESEGYTVTSENASGTVPAAGVDVSFTNTLNHTIPTGIRMNTWTFLMVMLAAAVLLFGRRRGDA